MLARHKRHGTLYPNQILDSMALTHDSFDKIPSAFIITGPNIASQNLLFEQLSESLQSSSQSKFVRLRSSEASTLKAALKKTLRDVMDDDELDAGDVSLFEYTRKHELTSLDETRVS